LCGEGHASHWVSWSWSLFGRECPVRGSWRCAESCCASAKRATSSHAARERGGAGWFTLRETRASGGSTRRHTHFCAPQLTHHELTQCGTLGAPIGVCTASVAFATEESALCCFQPVKICPRSQVKMPTKSKSPPKIWKLIFFFYSSLGDNFIWSPSGR